MAFLPLFRGLKAALGAELALLKQRKLVVACLAIVFVPSLFAVIYLSSLWDPMGQLKELPVAIANVDEGARYMGRHHTLGKRVLDRLVAQGTFKLHVYGSEAEARRSVESGEAYFALVLPADFSERSLRADGDRPAELKLLSGMGTGYMASAIGKRFASEVTASVNQTLGEQRWGAVFGQMGSLRGGVGQLRDGARQLESGLTVAADGSTRLHQGATDLSDGVTRLTSGMTRVGGAVRLMASKTPSATTLDRLAAGSAQLATGSIRLRQGLEQFAEGQSRLATKTGDLANGLERLDQGARQLSSGAHELTTSVRGIPLVGGRIAGGSGRLEAGALRLQGGASGASLGARQLAQGADVMAARMREAALVGKRLDEGAAQVNEGVQRLTSGMKQLSGGLRTLSVQLPPDGDLERLAAGSRTLASKTGELEAGVGRLRDGGDRLSEGLDLLYSKLPAQAGDALGMATAVTLREVSLDQVPNSGTAMAPYFMALALWLGGVMTTFLLHYNRAPEPARPASQGARMVAKAAIPAGMVSLQAVVLALTMHLGLRIAVPDAPSFFGLLLVGGLTFLAVIMSLVLVLGDGGRLLAILLMAFQLGAAGGITPVELSNDLFRTASPYLPMTNVVMGLRATLFGAYGGEWLVYGTRVAAAGLLALGVTWLLGRWRWRFVPTEAYGPVPEL